MTEIPKGYGDMGDIVCPKCGCEDFEWKNIWSDCGSDTWECTCDECGHKFTVEEVSYYKVEEE